MDLPWGAFTRAATGALRFFGGPVSSEQIRAMVELAAIGGTSARVALVAIDRGLTPDQFRAELLAETAATVQPSFEDAPPVTTAVQ